MTLQFIPKSEFDRVIQTIGNRNDRLLLIADMCRLNTLVSVKKAGSGHLGSSLSAMDLNVWLYFEELNVRDKGFQSPDRDIFFSSKGHDVPGLYAVFHAIGFLSDEKLFSLRRLGGLDGHPDVRNPGSEANTGSLGMGISKGRGMAWAKKHQGLSGRVFVMTGDGELQEGQIWESLQTTMHQKIDMTMIVDHNKLQTDMPVAEIIDLADIERKIKAFGWEVHRFDGNNFEAIAAAFSWRKSTSGPSCLLADTVKGRGISFMEDIASNNTPAGKYFWHSGAPADEPFQRAFDEIHARVAATFEKFGLGPVVLAPVPTAPPLKTVVSKEYVAAAYGEELVSLGRTEAKLVVLDGDLAADCKIRGFEEAYPDRFIENGIAEQDMVSLAGGLARGGMIPVCNSFSSFLCARANEQIYNNCCEGTKVIYAAHFAGMIPAGPGKSHQSVRDIGLLGSLANMTIVQPCNLTEARELTRWAVTSADTSVCLRLNIGPSPRSIELPVGHKLAPGRGAIIRDGSDAVLFAYGPVMLNEALLAAEIAQSVGISIAVANQPWLTRFEEEWLRSATASVGQIFTLDDHMLDGGLGERLAAFMAETGLLGHRKFVRFGLRTLPACGTPVEVLRHHRLDGASLASDILESFGVAAPVDSEKAVYDTLEAAQ